MKSLKEITVEQPSWIQPKALIQTYELRTEADLFGTVVFPKMLGSLAEAEAFEGRWTFKRVGFFATSFTVREIGTDKDIAQFKPKWTGTSGTMEFGTGKAFHWQSSNFWSTKFDFVDGAGNIAVSFRAGVEDAKLKDWFKTQARVEVSEGSKSLKELPLLVLFGWYLIVVLQMESSTGAVVAAAS